MPSVTIELSDEAVRRVGVMATLRGVTPEAWIAHYVEREAEDIGDIDLERAAEMRAAAHEGLRRWAERTPEQVLAARERLLKSARPFGPRWEGPSPHEPPAHATENGAAKAAHSDLERES